MVEILTLVALGLDVVFMLFAVLVILVIYGDLVRRGIAPPLLPALGRKSKEHMSRAEKAQAAIDKRGGVNG
jgi:hypothetical protein